jgi:putative cell wall-binding protein
VNTNPANASRYSFQQPRRKLLINQRKRVAKRLASGLLAGALALGGLAISGASPASAEKAPVLRIYGANRYDTSAQIAYELQASVGAALDTVIITSGENYPDALAASAMVKTGTNEAAILLTQKDALPVSVANFLSNPARVASSAQIYVIGGTSAVSDAVVAEIKTLGFVGATQVQRVSGADRYLTAIEVSKNVDVTNTSDIIIVSGTSFADGVAIGAVAASQEFPVLLAGPSGLSTETQARLKALLAVTGTDETIHIIGGTSAVPSVVEEQIVSTAVGGRPAQIKRYAGADRYATAALVSAVATAVGHTAGLMLVTGENFADALSASALAAEDTLTPVLTASSALGTSSSAAVAAYVTAETKPEVIVVAGGTSAVSNVVAAAAQAVSPTKYDLTFAGGAAVAGVVDAATKGVAVFKFTAAADPSALVTPSTAMFTVNNSAFSLFAGAAVSESWDAVTKTYTISATRTDAFAAGDVISFLGLPEGSAGAPTAISVAPGTVTAAADTTAPTVTLTGWDEDNTATDIATFAVSDPSGVGLAATLDATDMTVAVTNASGVAVTLTGAPTIAEVAAGGVLSGFTVTFGTVNEVQRGFTVTLTMTDEAGADCNICDVVGNAVKIATPLSFTVPSTSAVGLTSTFVEAATAAALVTLPNAGNDATITMNNGTAAAPGAARGRLGNTWMVRMSNSAVALPSVSIDSASNTIVFTMDFTKHKTADMKWAWDNNATAVALGTFALNGGDGLLDAAYITGNAIVFAGGTSTPTFTVTSTAPLGAIAAAALGASLTESSATGDNLANCTNAAVAAAATSITITCDAVGVAAKGSVVLAASTTPDFQDNTNAQTTLAVS